jgi:hypothetical protein
MTHLSHALSTRLLLVLVAVCFVLLLLVVLLLGHAHLGGMPVPAQESMAFVN